MGLNKYNIDKILQHRIIFQESNMQPIDGDIVKYGYTCYSDHYDAVIYCNNNRISYFPTAQNFQCISFGFSGCYMARYQLYKRFFTAHIPPQMITKWNDFVGKYRNHITGCVFNPVKLMCRESNSGKYPGNKIWGIITNNNVCIALEVYENYKYVFDDSELKMIYNKLGASKLYMNSIIRTKMEATYDNLFIDRSHQAV